MDNLSGPTLAALCTVAPVLLIVGGLGLLVLLPILRAPSVGTIDRLARKRIRNDPEITRDELCRYLRRQFQPAGMRGHDDGLLPGAESRGRGVAIEFLLAMRFSLALMLIEGRIDKALADLGFVYGKGAEGRRTPRRRRRGY